MKKGQTAMEYLMTYGWAILIVIVVIAALYSMGVFTLTGGVTCSPCFDPGTFAYVDYADGTLKINSGPEEKYIELVDLSSGTASIDACNETAGDDPCESGDPITITGIGTVGDVTITIVYNLTSSHLLHNASATIHN